MLVGMNHVVLTSLYCRNSFIQRQLGWVVTPLSDFQ